MVSGYDLEDGSLVPMYEFRHLTFQEYLTARAIVDGYYPAHAPAVWPARRAFEIGDDLHGANLRRAPHRALGGGHAHQVVIGFVGGGFRLVFRPKKGITRR